MLLEKKTQRNSSLRHCVGKMRCYYFHYFLFISFLSCMQSKKNPKASIQKKMILSAIKDLIYDIWLFLASSNWSRQCMNNIHGIVNNVVFNAMYVTMHVV